MANLVEKSRASAPVWKYFGLKATEDGKIIDSGKATCRLCSRDVAARGSNTSNLTSHIRNKHPAEYSDLLKASQKKTSKRSSVEAADEDYQQPGGSAAPAAKQPKIEEAFEHQTKYQRTDKRWQKMTESVTRYIAKDMLPLHTVEKDGFKHMLRVFDSKYELPGRKYFSHNAIPKLYSSLRRDVADELRRISHCALTADLWSSNTLTPYMSLTAHFITDDWKLKSRCLNTSYFPDSHTSVNLQEGLKSALDEWGLQEASLSCLTTDNGANIVACARELGWTWLSCFGHNLNLAVTGALEKESQRTRHALGLCKSIVSAFSYSWKKRRDLAEAQESLGLPKHSLVMDVATRWGSKQKMIRRVLEQAPAIRRVLADDKRTHLTLNWQDLSVLEAVDKALTPLAQLTDIMSGENHITSSSILPMLHHLKDMLSECDGDVELCTTIKSHILNKMTCQYDKPATHDVIAKACFLDPRYKSDFLDDTEYIKSLLIDEAAATSQSTDSDRTPEAADDECTEPVTETSKTSAAPRSLGALLSRHKASKKPSTALSVRERIEAELTQYLALDHIDGEACALQWWRQNSTTMPNMAKLAQKYLCISASSSPSERVFSAAGNIVTKKRSLLNPDKVNKLVFLSKNL